MCPIRFPRGPSACLALITAFLCFSSSSPAATPAQINDAIAKGVRFLYAIEKGDNWEEAGPDAKGLKPDGSVSAAAQYGGRTAICAYALLAAGEKPRDNPKLAAAIAWLLKADLRGTYAVALRAQVWNLIDQSRERDVARDADAQFLLDSVIQKGPYAGFYGYSYGVFGQKKSERKASFGAAGPGLDFVFDRSNSQYGVLGVWALEQAGADIPEKYWEIVDKGWRDSQQPSGGWDYSPMYIDGQTVRPTMACAGVATLFITQDYLLRTKRWDPCNGGVSDPNIDKGLAYIEKHIRELITGESYYGAYGVERIATASGHKYLGSIDWFQMGSDYAIKQQDPNVGYWDGSWSPPAETCFALLFLSRGRAPLMMNKLQYSVVEKKEGGSRQKEVEVWNERPRDVANLARWMGTRIESPLNWQIVNLSVPPGELHDAPILYISGGTELKLTDADVATLRTFVEQGGMILGSADCGSLIFSRSFQKLGNQLFRQYEFRQLAATHLIFTEQYHASKWKVHPKLMGLSNGVREMMILIPDGDAARVWQVDATKMHPEFFELGANIFLYATDRQNLVFKGDPYVVLPSQTVPTQTLKIARIETDSNWNPEPGGWARLAAIFHNTRDTQLVVEPVKPGAGKLADYRIAHLTGTGRLTLTDDARKELKDFVARGGTLIIDAAGGDAQFATSAELELKTIFGDEATAALAKPLALDDPLYSAGEKIDSVSYRQYATRSLTGGLKSPRICGVPSGPRIGVFYSREDLSAGLVGEPVDGIIGYDPASATRLMANIITYAQLH